MNRIIGTALLLGTMVWLASCAPSMNAEWNNANYQKRPAKNVLVISMFKDLGTRTSLDNNIIQDLRRNHSYNYTRGIDLFPPNSSEKATEASLKSKINDKEVDLVIATTFVNAYQSEQYNPGPSNYVPYFYGYGGMIYSGWNYMYNPGYYENVTNFVLVTSIYDTRISQNADSCLVWQGESTVYDPASISSGASDYADNLVRYLDKNNILP